jgi:hypothetical protein
MEPRTRDSLPPDSLAPFIDSPAALRVESLDSGSFSLSAVAVSTLRAESLPRVLSGVLALRG